MIQFFLKHVLNVFPLICTSREGIMKLKDVYAGNPALGDPTTLDKKIEENSQKLDGLRQELLKYEVVQGCYFFIFCF